LLELNLSLSLSAKNLFKNIPLDELSFLSASQKSKNGLHIIPFIFLLLSPERLLEDQPVGIPPVIALKIPPT
jgi:hypothetical protein